jgi:hypothetical protein
MMVSVATGGARINDVNVEYQREFRDVDVELRRRAIPNPVPYPDLWDWHGRWSSGDLPSYRSRRQVVGEWFNPLLDQIRGLSAGRAGAHPEPTGWARVDRAVGEMRLRLAEARTEEQHQAIGLLCREALISLAQAVFDSARHPSLDGTAPSATDTGRMLEAYLAVELRGGPEEEARRHAKAALALALALQHRRTADFRQAAMCVEATTAVINVIAIASGQRDPGRDETAS